MTSSQLRAAARQALSGKWALAVIAGLIAVLLNGASSTGTEFNFKYENGGVHASMQLGVFDFDISPAVIAFLTYTLIATLALALLLCVLGSVIRLGYARFNLSLIDGETPDLGALFSYFPWFKTAFCARFLVGLYIFLWSLLLIIPGICATYSYAMTSYILAENPDLTAREAIARSKEMMYGHRWDLFWLYLTFIGWSILAALTLGIGYLWLNPYIEASVAAFYRDISGTAKALPELEF